MLNYYLSNSAIDIGVIWIKCCNEWQDFFTPSP